MASDVKPGNLLVGGEERDAIHIAIAPCLAGEDLLPGEAVGFVTPGDYETVAYKLTDRIGIVDPYLTVKVKKGERCWVFLYPGTVTSLKHQWTHPAFTRDGIAPRHMAAVVAASEEWLRNFVEQADAPDYETVIAVACGEQTDEHPQWSPEYLHFRDRDAHGEIPDEFWHHVEVVTGKKITRRPHSFSCAC